MKNRERTRGGYPEQEYRTYRYVSLVSESPHPLKRIPGAKHCYWDSYIGRWVKV